MCPQFSIFHSGWIKSTDSCWQIFFGLYRLVLLTRTDLLVKKVIFQTLVGSEFGFVLFPVGQYRHRIIPKMLWWIQRAHFDDRPTIFFLIKVQRRVFQQKSAIPEFLAPKIGVELHRVRFDSFLASPMMCEISFLLLLLTESQAALHSCRNFARMKWNISHFAK